MRWQGQFYLPGAPEQAIRHFADLPRMAACMPGASIDDVDEDGAFTGSMLIAFGPKKLLFKGKGRSEIDHLGLSGALHGQGAADLRAARFKVNVVYTLHADDSAPLTNPRTIVELRSHAELQGVLAGFARMGGPLVADALMKQFAERAAIEFGQTPERTARQFAIAESHAQQNPRALSVTKLFRVIVADFARRIWRPGKKA